MSSRWAGAIATPDDVRRVLDTVNRASLDRATTTALAHAVQPAEQTEITEDASRLLPIDDRLKPLLPWPGLRRGATVATVGSHSLILLLLAAVVSSGAYAAVCGLPGLGLLAAGQDHRMALDRLALVPDPGPDWPTVVGALLDGVALVVVNAPADVSERTIRSLQSRARDRGAVLVPTRRWPGADVVLEVTGRRWEGLSRGRGRLKRQRLTVTAGGRGKAARPRTADIVVGDTSVPVPLPPPSLEPPPSDLRAPVREADAWAGLTANANPDLWASVT
ncbi:hypothetical protein ACFY36_20410 [Actinoplanes sp. NPDC000266]